jgi:hypothetical protein
MNMTNIWIFRRPSADFVRYLEFWLNDRFETRVPKGGGDEFLRQVDTLRGCAVPDGVVLGAGGRSRLGCFGRAI